MSKGDITYHIHLGVFRLSELYLNEILKDLFSQWILFEAFMLIILWKHFPGTYILTR